MSQNHDKDDHLTPLPPPVSQEDYEYPGVPKLPPAPNVPTAPLLHGYPMGPMMYLDQIMGDEPPKPAPVDNHGVPGVVMDHELPDPNKEMSMMPDMPDMPPGTEMKMKKRKRMKKPMQGEPLQKKRRSNKSTKGLRFFSKKVCEKVQEKKKTTYAEVAHELVQEYTDKTSPKEDQIHEEKNIRRRVYDALNVLQALDIIGKNRKEISWKGFPVNFQQEFDVLAKQKNDLAHQTQDRRRQLIELERQKLALTKLFQRNDKDDFKNVDNTSKVQLPFIVVHTNKDTVIECQMDSDATECFFNFSEPFEIHDDNEILQRIFHKEFLTHGMFPQSELVPGIPQIPPVGGGGLGSINQIPQIPQIPSIQLPHMDEEPQIPQLPQIPPDMDPNKYDDD